MRELLGYSKTVLQYSSSLCDSAIQYTTNEENRREQNRTDETSIKAAPSNIKLTLHIGLQL
jgi:hypothetical protein